MKRGPKVRPAAERFERLVDRSGGPDACHPWKGHRNRRGHGQFNVGDGERVYAHRFAFAQHHGRPVADGMHVLHRPVICHEPSCCNGAHLYEGTDVENTRDKQIDDTMPRGTVHWAAAVTEADIPVILALYWWSGFRSADIAEEYGITRQGIWGIVARRAWRHVPWSGSLTRHGY